MKRATAMVLATILAMTMAAPAYSDDGRVKCWKFWKKAFWTSSKKC